MENKKYLTEENYNKTKKKLSIIAIVIFVIGTLLGVILIRIGVVKTKNELAHVDIINQQKAIEAKKKQEEIELKIDELENQYNKKEQECDSLPHDSNWFANVNQCRRESSAIRKDIDELESQMLVVKNYEEVEGNMIYVVLCVLGGIIVIISISIALKLFITTKKREIIAFTAQQVIPLAKEGIDEMSPTVGNAMGTIGKELAKGIKEGIDESSNNKQQ